MKKISILVFVLLNSVFSQQMSEMYVVDKGEYLPNEIITTDNRDANGAVCAGLKIQTDLDGLSFDSNNGIVKRTDKPGEYFLFLSSNERLIKVLKTGFKPLEIILYDFGINLESGKVWKLEITGDKISDMIPVNIVSSPPGAEIWIDGENKGKGVTQQLGLGSHSLKLLLSGYKIHEETINVTQEGNTLFRIALEEVEPQLVKIRSNPMGASILVDNILKGETNKDLFLFPGEYSLKLTRSGFLDINEIITVKENSNNQFNYSFIKNSVTLTLNITPSDANVLLNKENYSNRRHIELAPGTYKLEISKTGYTEESEIITLELNKPQTKSFSLVRKTGKLQFTVNPVDARVTMKQGGNVIKNWSGSTYLRDIGVGEYTLEIVSAGYQAKAETVTITENETAVTDIKLIKNETTTSTTATATQQNKGSMVFVQGGTFMMGSNNGNENEKPVHKVTVSDFYIGKYEVTFEEYDKFCEATGRTKPNDSGWGRGKRPVINISWNDAKAYCEWAGGRLPTEAEWEYAARGASSSLSTYKYSGSNNIDEVAWYSSNSGNKTHEVGTKKANELGIYDMSGNVWEWCNDWYAYTYYSNSPANNPLGPSSGSYRVLRGGSWGYLANYCRTSPRYYLSPDRRYLNNGFRLAQDF